MEPKQKQHPGVDVMSDTSKVRCYKEQSFIGSWNVWYMNQGKLEMAKQEIVRVKIDLSGISEQNGLEWVNLIQMSIISINCG